MAGDEGDTGVIEVLLLRLNRFRLPRLLELKDRVESGDTLGEADIEFLMRVLEGVRSAQGMFDRHPELQPLGARLTGLYHAIVARALENEKNTLGR